MPLKYSFTCRFHQCAIDPEKVDHLLEDMNQLKFDVEDLMNKVATMSATPGN